MRPGPAERLECRPTGQSADGQAIKPALRPRGPTVADDYARAGAHLGPQSPARSLDGRPAQNGLWRLPPSAEARKWHQQWGPEAGRANQSFFSRARAPSRSLGAGAELALGLRLARAWARARHGAATERPPARLGPGRPGAPASEVGAATIGRGGRALSSLLATRAGAALVHHRHHHLNFLHFHYQPRAPARCAAQPDVSLPANQPASQLTRTKNRLPNTRTTLFGPRQPLGALLVHWATQTQLQLQPLLPLQTQTQHPMETSANQRMDARALKPETRN